MPFRHPTTSCLVIENNRRMHLSINIAINVILLIFLPSGSEQSKHTRLRLRADPSTAIRNSGSGWSVGMCSSRFYRFSFRARASQSSWKGTTNIHFWKRRTSISISIVTPDYLRRFPVSMERVANAELGAFAAGGR